MFTLEQWRLLLYTERSRWKTIEEETLHRRVERCFKMRFVQFCTRDGNYSVQGNIHKWDLPLRLENRRVGLHSFYLEMKPEADRDHLLVVSCNLIDRTMENQFGILASLQANYDGPFYSKESTTIRKL